MNEKHPIYCPFCKKEIYIESIREFTDGSKRLYWACTECNVSVMKR